MQSAGPTLVAALAVATASAGAQQPADSAIAIDSIVVEALRLPASLADAPFAVTVLGPTETRTARSGDGLAEILRGVPGLQTSDRESEALGERIVVRGAGARAAFGVRGLRVLIDGIPATLPDGQTDLSRLDHATIDRIEVVRGPASALYGNASGGVLRITSVAPSSSGARVDAHALVGSDDLVRVHGRVSGQPARAWYDASATHRRGDGWRAHSDFSKTFVRAAGGLPLLAGAFALRLEANRYDARNPGSLDADLAAADPRSAWPSNVAQQTGEQARQVLAGGTWLGMVGPGTLELAGYTSARELGNPIPVAIIEVDRLLSGVRALYGVDAAIDAAFGAELDLQRDDRLNFANEAGERGARTLDQLERVRALGLFGHARAPLGSRADVSAGLRYDRFRFAVDDHMLADGVDDGGARTMHALSPSLGLHVRVARDVDAFANVATAFETPTTTELANRPSGAGGFNPDLDPQRTRSFEAGVRGRPGVARFELVGWIARTRDALLPFEVPSAPDRRFYRNAGSTSAHGIELAVGARLPAGFDASFAWGWIDATFDEFTVDGTSFAGNSLPGVAPHRIDASLAHRASSWMVALEATHNAAVPVNDANDAEAEAWTVLDARAEVRLPLFADRVWLYGGVDNITGTDYAGSVVVNQFAGRWFEPAPDRTVFAGLRTSVE
ncbi:MAG TPA: TonB-dependent receptor [Longimicrobiales bacterium]